MGVSGGEQRNSENFGAAPQNGGDWPFLTLRRKKRAHPHDGGEWGIALTPSFWDGGE